MLTKSFSILALSLICYTMLSCSTSDMIDGDMVTTPKDSTKTDTIVKIVRDSTLSSLFKSYELLTEKLITSFGTDSTYATYITPTDRYKHGIMGDAIEGGGVAIYYKGKIITLTLDENYVFEDQAPRLYDVTGDGVPEIICIRSHVQKGAGIVIYEIKQNALVVYAEIPEIGIPNRWLNIAYIGDLNQDGMSDITWMQTPHIGGILKFTTITRGTIISENESTLYSNHAIGERNLCMSFTVLNNGRRILYLPSHDRTEIVSLVYDKKWIELGRIKQQVNFSRSLRSQIALGSMSESQVCIDGK